MNIPHEFLCPLTQDIMKNPLMSRYGQTYERDAIITWLSNHNNLCPFTKNLLKFSDLIRNRALEKQIEFWKTENGIVEFMLPRDVDQEVDEDVRILLTFSKSDVSSYSDHNPKQMTLDPKPIILSLQGVEENIVNKQRQQEQYRLGRRILRLIRSSR